ncbi:MAG TPA: hypothetical protein VEJ20_08945, partial [Candidatus Eremiobacteraceae bacterium]|nr:hypothetical protein [Candidatus Eremiobacteraceae bacterium]
GSWTTRLRVDTTLGSGQLVLAHSLVSVSDGLAQIDVRGLGDITGAEYNLPRLLPGSIGIRGTYWFDVRRGIVTQESYLIENRLLKTRRGKTIGFDEIETVDVSTRVAGP